MYEGGGRVRPQALGNHPLRLRQGHMRSGGRTRAPALATGLPRCPVPAGGETPMRPRASVPVAASAAIAAALAMATTPAWAAPATVVVDSHDFTPNAVTINSGEAVTWDVREGGHN